MGTKAETANLITGTRILCSVALLFCTAATFAAIQEGHYIRTGRDDL